MENTYIIYLRNNEVQKLKTLKSYIKFRIKTAARAKIRAFWAYLDAQTQNTTS